ncbi:MAG: thioredoxin domain-containing protein, partial [Candidatus Aminicenantes bacterium]|nr:thioredoxin domain-containing protein [Candidatus Aminicenantes bacterium]
LGFGFHRYATDADWRVPHFEKMLYDQALLAEVYVEAYLAAGRDEFKRTASEIGDYVLGELASPEGAFFTAEDADSEGEEGRFYIWREDEILAALGKDEGERVARHFGVRPDGNFVEPGRGPDGRNVLHIGGADGSLWPDEGPAGEPRRRGAAVLRETLLRVRRLRPAPFKDTKILADGNGLMIGAMARLSRVSDDGRFGRAALRATDFLLERLRAPDGRLFHVFGDGRAFVPGFLDDYAFLAGGLIDLYESMFQPRHLAAAVACVRTALDLFWDEDEGGCFFSAEKPEIGVRRKEVYDGAVPSGNSVMLMNLLRLAEITGDRDFEERARLQMRAFAAPVGAHPRGSLEFLRAVDFGLGASRIVVVGDRDAPDARRFFEVLRRTYLPRAVIVHRPPAQAAPDIAALAPPVRDMTPVSGKAAVYICERGRCLPPVTTPEELLDLLRKGPVATP